jgi:hypothetical protein
METQKLSYYQRNKEKILAKRKLQREERSKLGRPFLNDDEEIVLEPEVVEPIPEPIPEPVVEPEPLDPVVTFLENVIIEDEKKTKKTKKTKK